MAFDQGTRELVQLGDKLFQKRQPLVTLWQSIAEQFYPERADFTQPWLGGEEFAVGLMTGRPVLHRRDLANSIAAMLRPRGKTWFNPRTNNEQINNDSQARRWLDMAGDRMRLLMYDKPAQFIRATKGGDNDWAAFGQCVISVDLNRARDGFLYRNWHLRDVVWCENAELVIDSVHRNWTLPAREIKRLFPKTYSPKLDQIIDKDPYAEIKCRHMVVPADQYGGDKKKYRLPFVSLYVDIDNEQVLETSPIKRLPYVIPRWQTVSGSQYAHSPASVIALPDARLLQEITLTLLEAGQKVVDPPLVGVEGAVQGGVNVYAGGVTWIDSEYDERTGEGLRTLNIDSKGLQWGVDREERVDALIKEAFYLNQIALPDVSGPDMTAYEVQKRVEEYIRRALPLFEPMEVEYNGGLCELTFQYMIDNGAFGDPRDIPQPLLGQDINWQFESPLQAANERAKSQAFMDSANLLQVAVQVDPATRFNFDANKAFRAALQGVAKADWITSEQDAAQAQQADAQHQQLAQMAQMASAGAAVTSQVAGAAQDVHAANKAAQQAQQAP